MNVHLQISGWLLIGLALSHAIFPRYFKWAEELSGITLLTRQVMYVHTFFIAVTVLLMGILCVTETEALLSTDLGHKICLGFGLFWFLRLLVQHFGYRSELWRGKRFETGVHIVFTLLWTYLTFIFFVIALLY